jgi:hypothetical protein
MKSCFSDILGFINTIAQAGSMSKTALNTKKHVRASFRDAVYTSLNIGMSESYFCAFMLALGLSEVVSGLGTVIPQFIGVIFQLFSISSFFTRYSLKRRLILFLSLQAISMLPLILAGIYKIQSAYLVLGILGLYWACLLSLNPPWNRLIGHTVPEKFRLKFFSIRNQIGQSFVFLGLIGSGISLYYAKNEGKELLVFVIIFSLGLFLKLMSIYEIKTNHNDYDLAPGSEHRVQFREFIKRLQGTEQGKLINFLFLFYVTVHFASPYFGPYMLRQLKLNYIEYMAIVSLSFFGRVFMFKLLQKWAKSRQVNTILLLSTLGISTSPILWAISQNYWWICSIEFLSGCYWAGFELSTILLYYQKIDDRERTSVITYISFLNVTGMLLGSLLGALFMKLLPANMDHYLTLFTVATFLRVILIIFAPQVDFRGQIPKLISYNRVMSIRPPFGAFTRPIVGKVKKNNEKEK